MLDYERNQTLSMESFTKVSISELSQNLVPRSEVSEAKKSKTDLSCSSQRFDLVRTFGDKEFRVPIQTLWIQGYILNTSTDGQVIEVADDTNHGNSERVLVTGCNKVNTLGSRITRVGNGSCYLASLTICLLK